MTEILYQILLAVAIIAGLMLIVNLWRLQTILRRAQKVAAMAETQIVALNNQLESLEKFLAGQIAALQAFLQSFDFLRKIKDKLVKEREGEKDEQGK